jgi:sigma-E factor negative regulatory protein RseC
MLNEVIVEEGVVLSVENGFAEVSIYQNGKCDDCSAKIICRPLKNDINILNVIDPLGAKIGDNVRIEIGGKSILKVSFNLYGIPLILLMIGIFFGASIFYMFQFSELYSVLFGFSLLVIYFVFTFLHQKKKQNQILPKIVFIKRTN